MAWTEASRTDPERYEVTGWDIEMNGDRLHMATATVATNVGTSSRTKVRFKVHNGGRAVLHEVEDADSLALDVLTTVLAIAEAHATDVAGIESVDSVADRVRRVNRRLEAVEA